MMSDLKTTSEAFQFTSTFSSDDKKPPTAATGENCLNHKCLEEKGKFVKLDLVKTSWFALYQDGRGPPSLRDTAKPDAQVDYTTMIPRESVLGNGDLLEYIFAFLQTDFESEGFDYEERGMKANRATLRHAALTCTAFRDPALHVLWRVIDTFDPLLRLLPAYCSNRNHVMDIIHPEDFNLLDKYATHVRYFRAVTSFPNRAWSEWAYLILSRYHPTPLLPRLKTVYIESAQSALHGHQASLFLTAAPTLEGFSIKTFYQGDEVMVANLLINTLLTSPKLKKVELRGPLTDKIICALHRFSSLQFLQLEFKAVPVGFATLVKISSLPLLRHLDLASYEHPPFTSSWTDAVNFPNLESVRMEGEPSTVERLLVHIKLPGLKRATLDIRNSDSDSAKDPTEFLAKGISHLVENAEQLLQVLSLELPKSPSKKTPWSLLKCLQRCHLLRRLEITYGSMTLSDDDLLSMCAFGEWRNMEYLKVLPSGGREGDEVLSLNSLKFLAEQCPKLKSLHTCINIPADALGDLQQGGAVKSAHGLRELWLYKLTGDDIDPESDSDPQPTQAHEADLVSNEDVDAKLAKYISKIFPELKRLEIGRFHDGEVDS